MQEKKLLTDLMSDKDLARVEARQLLEDEKKASFTTREWLALSEFGFYYGWGAIEAVFNDVITLTQMDLLIKGARKIHSGHVYDSSVSNLAANSKERGYYEKLMKRYIDDMNEVN